MQKLILTTRVIIKQEELYKINEKLKKNENKMKSLQSGDDAFKSLNVENIKLNTEKSTLTSFIQCN